MRSSDGSEIPDRWWDESRSSRPTRANGLAWLAIVGASLLIFELTSTPSLAVALGCLKFGWHDFLTARRIRIADPDHHRGRVRACFTLAWGLVKVSLIATV